MQEMYVTRGAEGAVYISREDEVSIGPVKIKEPKPGWGKGDAFSGGILASRICEFNYKETLTFSSYLASRAAKVAGGFPKDLTKELFVEEALQVEREQKYFSGQGIDIDDLIGRMEKTRSRFQ